MLKWRILTAAVLIPLVLLILFLAPFWLFAILCQFILVGAALEWLKLAKVNDKKQSLIYLVVLVLSSLLAFYFLPILTLILALFVWMLACLLLVYFPKGKEFWLQHLWLRLVSGAFVLVPFTVSLLCIFSFSNGALWLLLLLLLVWSADTGAYFSGRFYGKHLFAPKISPKKTQEGVYGGIAAALLVACLFAFFFDTHLFYQPVFYMLIILTPLLAIIGDLFESALKRFADVKDSGQILPGHGGILDRIDSLTAAAPGFALGLLLLQTL